MNDFEIWKDVRGYEGIYQVSNMGQVRSLDRKEKHTRYGKEYYATRRGRILKQHRFKGSEYLSIMLTKEQKVSYMCVHRLVADTFIRPLIRGDRTQQVHHRNGNKQDNRLCNLEILSSREHRRLHGQKYPITKNCEVCGREYTPIPTMRKLSKVCSKECEHKYRMKLGKRYAKKVAQFDLDGNLIKVWDSFMDIERSGNFYSSCVSKCCRGKAKQHKGYIWEYADNTSNLNGGAYE